MGRNSIDDRPVAVPGLEPEDYYFEGPNLVFTAAYHLKRGSCCGSGCRHCPYDHANVKAVSDVDQRALPPEDEAVPPAAG